MLHSRTLSLLSTLALLAPLGSLSAQSVTLVSHTRWAHQSLDAKGGTLADIQPSDLFEFTPAKAGTAAYQVLPAAGLAATTGDADANGQVAQFNGLAIPGLRVAGAFVKHADRKKDDPRLIYWTIKELKAANTSITVFKNGAKHVMRAGDFERIRADGNAEFFITQDQLMKAVGTQNAAHVKGTNALCQSASGSLYFIGGHGWASSQKTAGGIWVNGKFLYDGGIAHIPASAITYDKSGNVSAIKANSATIVINEVSTGPSGQPNIRALVTNSGFTTAGGGKDSTTLWLTGLDIDPNGGTIGYSWDGIKTHPNLIFVFQNYKWATTRDSWAATIFSTATTSLKVPGVIATINGVPMGVTTGKASGAWTGLSNASRPPSINGLAWRRIGHKSSAPSGTVAANTKNAGVTVMGTDPTMFLDFQGPERRFPAALLLGAGPSKGSRQIGADLSFLLSGYADLHALKFGPLAGSLGVTDASGRVQLSFPTPKDTSLKGQSLVWQAFFLRIVGKAALSNPVLTELR